MYGIIGTAILAGVIFIQISKKGFIKNIEGTPIIVPKKDQGIIRYIVGGMIFGLGWALVGACPGPMYILIGTGLFSILIVIAAAIMGTFIYGLLKDKLPH